VERSGLELDGLAGLDLEPPSTGRILATPCSISNWDHGGRDRDWSAARHGRGRLSDVMEQGVAKMRPVEGGLEIKPGETVELKPGSFHIMLTGLKQPLEKGQKVWGTLEFEKAGKVDIEYAVEALGAASPAPAGQHMHH